MKLSSSLLSALLALSSASLQDIVEGSPQHRNVSLLNPVLQDKRFASFPPPAEQRMQQDHFYSAMLDKNAKLKWQTWNGSLPKGAVSISNSYAQRVDYICQYKCNAGFYNPDLGSYCRYPYGDKEYPVSNFEILVNEDGFEILEWKKGSYGSVPENSIRTCSGDRVFVGKNKYGLGKVHPRNQAFFLPWEGKEYWYKNYMVLTINKDVESEQISDVKYNISGAEIIQYPPETMRISTITNNECNSVSKTITLSKTSRVEKRWDIGSSIMLGVKKTFSGGVPNVVSSGVEISFGLSFEFSGGHTYSEESSHSVSVALQVPPNHFCAAYMLGYRYKTNIPFSAHLSRTYYNRESTSTLITGMYDSVEIGEVRAVVERCEPVTDAKPCS